MIITSMLFGPNNMEQSGKIYMCSDESTLFDQNYRYQVNIPVFDTINQKGTDITLFINSDKFAKSIQINEETLVKILATKLSCQGGIEKHLKVGYFKGKYAHGQITSHICGFIRTYLLCKSCDRPEVIIQLKKKKLRQTCAACGAKTFIEDNCFDKTYDIVTKSLV
jgi:translation initiation factor 2 beta subunit (eIF-2beta)/eIF-5